MENDDLVNSWLGGFEAAIFFVKSWYKDAKGDITVLDLLDDMQQELDRCNTSTQEESY